MSDLSDAERAAPNGICSNCKSTDIVKRREPQPGLRWFALLFAVIGAGAALAMPSFDSDHAGILLNLAVYMAALAVVGVGASFGWQFYWVCRSCGNRWKA